MSSRLLTALRAIAKAGKRALFAAVVNPALRTRHVKRGVQLRLHIGCGSRLLQGWLNCDYDPQSFSTFFLDATQRLPFDTNSVSAIHCEHMLEHISFLDGQALVGDMYRVLEPGGVLRLSTPNLQKVLDLRSFESEASRYITWATDAFALPSLPSRYGAVVNNLFRSWGHQFLWDPVDLRHVLEQAGFRMICELTPGSYVNSVFTGCDHLSRMPEGLLRFESVVFEATKPRQ